MCITTHLYRHLKTTLNRGSRPYIIIHTVHVVQVSVNLSKRFGKATFKQKRQRNLRNISSYNEVVAMPRFIYVD